MFLKEMVPDELQSAVERNLPLIVPLGCIEMHGNHLPLGTDTILVEEVCKRLHDRIECVIAPTVDYGPTGHAVSGPREGTIDVDIESFYQRALSIVDGIWDLGFKRIFIIIHHQGTYGAEALSFQLAISQVVNRRLKETKGSGWWGEGKDLSKEDYPQISVIGLSCPEATKVLPDDHAALGETSKMMYFRPELVKMEKLKENDFWYNWRPGDRSIDAASELGAKAIDVLLNFLIQKICDK